MPGELRGDQRRRRGDQRWRDRADVVVVGAGFGGIGAALTLAEAGADVVLLEALNYPGGCASTFSRDGYRFEAGATLFCGFAEGQPMQRWIERHGLDVAVDWLDPVIELRTPTLALPIDRDREAFVARMCGLPDAPEEGVKRFFTRQRQVADALWALFDDPSLLPPFGLTALATHLRRSPRYLPLLPLLGTPLGALLRRDGLADFAPIRILMDALCQITVQTDAATAEAPFALAATDYTFRGTAHVRDGIGQLAWALTGAVESLGGALHLSTRVRRLVRKHQHWEVVTRRGTVRAPVVIANLLPQTVLELATVTNSDDVAGLRRLGRRVADGWGAVMWYLGIEDHADLPETPHHVELIADTGAPFVAGNHIFCSLSGRDEERAPNGQRTVTVSTHVDMQRLRATDPAPLIDGIQRRMRQTLAALAPEIDTAVVHALPASPRTFARFTGRHHGLVGGIPRRAGLDNYRGLLPTPSAPGLHLVGDSTFPGQSTLATALGGLKTAQRVLAS